MLAILLINVPAVQTQLTPAGNTARREPVNAVVIMRFISSHRASSACILLLCTRLQVYPDILGVSRAACAATCTAWGPFFPVCYAGCQSTCAKAGVMTATCPTTSMGTVVIAAIITTSVVCPHKKANNGVACTR
eukprot:6643626-Pyramimonas_sp.AAC.1